MLSTQNVVSFPKSFPAAVSEDCWSIIGKMPNTLFQIEHLCGIHHVSCSEIGRSQSEN